MGMMVCLFTTVEGLVKEGIPITYTKKGLKKEPCIALGNAELILARGSLENYLSAVPFQDKTDVLVSYGYLFQGIVKEWSLIPLTKKQTGGSFDFCLVYLSKPLISKQNQSFQGGELLLQYLTEEYQEYLILLPTSKVLTIFNGNEKSYFVFDGKNLVTPTWSQIVFGEIRKQFYDR